MLSSLDKVRELEAASYRKALQGLSVAEQSRIERVNAEMARRGLQQSDACRQALFETRLDKLSQAINSRVEIRKELLRSYPELGSVPELKRLRESIDEEVTGLWRESQKCGLLVAPEMFSGLRQRGQEALELLMQEAASARTLKPTEPGPSSLASAPSKSKSKDPEADRLAKAYGATQEVVGEIAGRDTKLAAALQGLAAAIKESTELGNKRAGYMEQVQFIGEQTLRPPAIRKVHVVEGLFVALQIGLEDCVEAEIALRQASRAVASHFGIEWLSI